ncbi:MAG TPA: HAD hydrolase-like protein [Acidimicrobiales bacterium]|nr:HAD hydrolase-like protein [Acidimicrobiales bacterium]
MTSIGTTRSLLASVTVPGSVWVVDLDGVIWITGEPIGDVAAAVARLAHAGIAVVYATNNSAFTTQELLDRLTRIGITAEPEHLASSAAATASLLEPGDTVFVLAEGGVLESLSARGVKVGGAGPFDAAVVGWTHSFDFDSLSAAAAAARDSGRLIGTNEDPTHPTPDGLVPGSGALLAAVATASGVVPEIAGKPHRPMADLIREKFGIGVGGRPALAVGDQAATDGRLAEQLGVPFALVDSGVTRPGSAVDGVAVSVRTSDFVTLVDGALT